jgi:hypothetical protein
MKHSDDSFDIDGFRGRRLPRRYKLGGLRPSRGFLGVPVRTCGGSERDPT